MEKHNEDLGFDPERKPQWLKDLEARYRALLEHGNREALDEMEMQLEGLFDNPSNMRLHSSIHQSLCEILYKIDLSLRANESGDLEDFMRVIIPDSFALTSVIISHKADLNRYDLLYEDLFQRWDKVGLLELKAELIKSIACYEKVRTQEVSVGPKLEGLIADLDRLDASTSMQNSLKEILDRVEWALNPYDWGVKWEPYIKKIEYKKGER